MRYLVTLAFQLRNKAYHIGLFIMALICSINTYSQITSLPVAIPPSPNAASLGKYGDIPVGKYTGIPSVSIPLYNFSTGKLDMPITLDYSSSGLKVEELASWVGLGWSLNAGGVITRTVHGKPDEGSLGYWEYANRSDMELVTQESPHYSPVFTGGVDLEPDIFYYNFLGRSGKFVIDATPTHDVHCIPYQNLQILHGSSLGDFTIIDDGGNRFIFNEKETTILDDAATQYTSAWYLSKIITATSDTVAFSYYNDLEFTSMLQQSEVDYIKLPGSDNSGKGNESSSTGSSINGKILKQIDAPGDTIKFYVSRNRLDIPLCSVLDSITVQDYNGNIKKRFSLSHGYFGNSDTTHPEKSRLKLDSVIERSITNAEVKAYSLTYYSPQSVPPTDSKGQDYWGYYNGALNSTLLPTVSPLDYASLPEIHYGGDRDPDFNNAVVGVLQKIKYPTGGTSTFIYENNDYGFVRGVPVNEEVLTSSTVKASAVHSSLAHISSDTETFTIQSQQITSVTINGSYSDGAGGSENPEPTGDAPEVFLNRINTDNSRTQIIDPHPTDIQDTSTQYISLDSGNYEVIAHVDAIGQHASIQVDYKTPSGIILKTKLCGGIRIKQIVNADPVANSQDTTNYGYHMSDESDRSSGDLMVNPSLVELTFGGYLARSSYSCNYLASTQGSNVGYKLVTEFQSGANNSTNGRTESYYNTYPANFGGQGSGIDTIFFIVDAFNDTSYYLFAPSPKPEKLVNDFDVYRGNLLREAVYNKDGVLIKETINDYDLDSALNPLSTNYVALTTRKGYYFQTANTNSIEVQREYYFTVAKVACPWIYKTGTKERIYDANGINYLETADTFYYENPTHALITKTVTTNSKKDTLTTVYKYPLDSLSGLSTTAAQAKDSLVARHYISPILEQTTYKNSTQLNKVQTFYRNWSPGIIMPEFVQGQKGTNAPENRLQFYNYNTTGNILEQSKSDDVHEVYLWGYKHQYPVAKIIGSDYDTAIQYVDTAILQHPSNDSLLRTELNKLRQHLPHTLISTYTYNPLIGLTSETDPNNRITYYEYDGMGRLKLIRDQDQNIIKRFEYKYAGQ